VKPFQRAVAAVIVLVPALSGARFNMYAASVEFRLEIVAHDASGAARAIGPGTLAKSVTPSAAPFFAGSDHFRRTYGELPLRHQLHQVARLACTADGRAAEIDVTLFERRRGATRETHEHISC
jgi:hypothetical protein